MSSTDPSFLTRFVRYVYSWLLHVASNAPGAWIDDLDNLGRDRRTREAIYEGFHGTRQAWAEGRAVLQCHDCDYTFIPGPERRWGDHACPACGSMSPTLAATPADIEA